MSKCDELRKLLLEWGEGNYLPFKKKIAYLQNLRIKERNERLSMITKKRREEANHENR